MQASASSARSPSEFDDISEAQSRALFLELAPGDRIAILHQVKVGQKVWYVTTEGTVVRTERRRHGLHFRRNPDDKVYSDLLVLRRDDNELTTVTMDEFTRIKRIGS